MTKVGRTWWGKRFIEALEGVMDEGRLRRGRSYSGPNRLLAFSIEGSDVQAEIRGNINPYFGVHKEPRYRVHIRLKPIPAKRWDGILKRVSSNAAWLSKLLMNEMPDNIEAAFQGQNLTLLPATAKDLQTECSCPDWANPCKHIAGTYYRVASMLDADPLLLFELRGLPKARLSQELGSSPLGQALLAQLTVGSDLTLNVDEFRYSQPEWHTVPESLTVKRFWEGSNPWPASEEKLSRASVPAILIKKQGDFPAFWHRDNSFIEAMEGIYGEVRRKNADSL
ncbi:MAG: SWIM zinc finger family protein [Gammaproteobacteria bacterium]